MKAMVNPLFGVVGLVVLFAFGFVAYKTANPTTINKEVEAHNLEEQPQFEACVTDYSADGQIILVAPDVAVCGQSVSLMVDGNVINGEIDGIVSPAPFGTVQVSFIRDGKLVTALTQNQIADIIVR